jgi:hypothetical protein
MKKLPMILILLLSIYGYSQEHRGEKDKQKKELRNDRQALTPEQIAELSSKKMTLALDLSEDQQKQVQKILLERAEQKKANDNAESLDNNIDKKDKFESKINRLDDKIALKRSMKSVLNDTQFEKWEKTYKLKGKRHHRQHKKRSIPSEKR